MTFLQKLSAAIHKNNSLLCVGLDSDIHKLPRIVQKSHHPQFVFNKAIIDATGDLVSTYKINSAFYEGTGPGGIEQLKLTVDYIRETYPEIPVYIDAKRADIGNSNLGYIDYVFNYLNADAITLHPYLGREALHPFLDLKDKGMIILCRTSNPGAGELQDIMVDGRPLYQYLAHKIATEWNANGNCALVVGATYPKEMREIRDIVGDDM